MILGSDGLKNILLNVYEFHEPWAKNTLKKVLKKGMKVAVLTMSHGEDISDGDAWMKLYGEGRPVNEILKKAFGSYGITELTYVSWYHDNANSALEKVNSADILFMTGGLPHLLYDRMLKWKLVDKIKKFPGIVMGASAGAMVQMKEYHVTPDEDYPRYCYYKGLGLLDGFEPEVHFAATEVQMKSIARYQKERNKLVFAMANDGGLLIDGSQVSVFGNVDIFPEDEE